MGMDAKVSIWVGLDIQSLDDFDDEDFLSRLPDPIKDDGCLHWDDKVITKALDGLCVEWVSCGDERVAFGVVVFKHNWNNGVQPFNLLEVQEKINETSSKLTQRFIEWGIAYPIGVFVQTDYS